MDYAISVQELKNRLDKGDEIFLLDVREPHEFSMAKIEGSTLIPLLAKVEYALTISKTERSKVPRQIEG